MKYELAERLAAEWTSAQPTIGAFILSLVKDYHAAEEILSRVAVVLVRKYETYDPEQSFVSWAMGIARYEVLAQQRSYARDRHQFGDDLVEKMSLLTEEVVKEADPRVSYLDDCFDRIKGRARKAMTLRYGADMKPAKIAEVLQMSGSATRSLLGRTRDALRSCIERRVAEEGR